MAPLCEEGRGLWRGQASGSERACLLSNLATKNLTNIPGFLGR